MKPACYITAMEEQVTHIHVCTQTHTHEHTHTSTHTYNNLSPSIQLCASWRLALYLPSYSETKARPDVTVELLYLIRENKLNSNFSSLFHHKRTLFFLIWITDIID